MTQNNPNNRYVIDEGHGLPDEPVDHPRRRFKLKGGPVEPRTASPSKFGPENVKFYTQDRLHRDDDLQIRASISAPRFKGNPISNILWKIFAVIFWIGVLYGGYRLWTVNPGGGLIVFSITIVLYLIVSTGMEQGEKSIFNRELHGGSGMFWF
jgi:hypothetical protein